MPAIYKAAINKAFRRFAICDLFLYIYEESLVWVYMVFARYVQYDDIFKWRNVEINELVYMLIMYLFAWGTSRPKMNIVNDLLQRLSVSKVNHGEHIYATRLFKTI